MHDSGKLVAEEVAVGSLDKASRDRMWELFEASYADVTRERFEADLARKRDALLLRDKGDGSIQGFSTLQVLKGELQGERWAAVYSGDTIIAAGYRGQTALHRAFFLYVMRERLRHATRRLYWFLISKGFRTYLLLTRNFPNHWPRHDAPFPRFEEELLHHLCSEFFGEAWDRRTSTLHFDPPIGRLRADVAPVTEDELRHEDIRFFATRNPEHARGDELCCLGRIDIDFARHFIPKHIRRAVAQRRRR